MLFPSDLRSFDFCHYVSLRIELFVWRFDTFEKGRSNSNQMIIASLCVYFKISYLWNDKKKLLLEWNPLSSISSEKYRYRRWLQQGWRRTERRVKKGVKEKAMRRTGERRKVEVLESGSTLESTKCGAIGAVATCEPTSLERFTILAR